MEYISSTKDIKLNNTIVTIGKFDCFHRGHQLLFKVASEMKKPGMRQVIFTFAENPADVLSRVVTRHVISSGERKFFEMKNGTDYLIEYPFDDEIRNMSPDEFAEKILVSKLGAAAVVAGDDFRFGKDRAGDVTALQKLGDKYGFDVRIVERIRYNGHYISSTYIKEELLKGNLDSVSDMLGRPFSMVGIVSHGQHIGSGMGIPTVNFPVPEDKALPPDGVYASTVKIDGEFHPAITNIGVRPTFYDNGERFVETNILDFNGDVYGKKAVVNFHRFIRPERKFENAKELTAQIHRDIEEVRRCLSVNVKEADA